jgi:hypothetical protein
MTAPEIVGFDEAPSASQAPLPPPAEPSVAGRTTRRGRHFGPRPVDDPRSTWLTTRTTPEFLTKVRADAKAAGLPLSDYMHVALGGSPSPRARRTPSEATKMLAQLRGEMGKRGSNLNQGARALNEIGILAGEGAGRDRLAELIEGMAELHRQAIAEHRECTAAIMRALGLRPDADHY